MDINDKEFEYLVLQHGKISDCSSDRKLWEHKYEQSLYDTYSTMKNSLPSNVEHILDIGGGLGGIDALLIKEHYTHQPTVWILDGLADAPTHIKADQTFSNSAVASEFLQRNGVNKVGFINPNLARQSPEFGGPVKFDLIISNASYCFHYGPQEYLEFIKYHSHEDTVMILDVRAYKDEWVQQLIEAGFNLRGVLFRAIKYDRLIFKRRQNA